MILTERRVATFKMNIVKAIEEVPSSKKKEVVGFMENASEWVSERVGLKTTWKTLCEEFMSAFPEEFKLVIRKRYGKYYSSLSSFENLFTFKSQIFREEHASLKFILDKETLSVLSDMLRDCTEKIRRVSGNNYKMFEVQLEDGRTIMMEALSSNDLLNLVMLEYGNLPSAFRRKGGTWQTLEKEERKITYLVKIQVDCQSVCVKVKVPKNTNIRTYIEHVISEQYAKGATIIRYEKHRDYSSLIGSGVRQCSSPKLRSTGNPGRLGHVTYKIGF